MNEEMCQNFKVVWDDFPDTLDVDENYNFETSGFCDTYCDGDCDENCVTDLDKFNAGCLYLFKTFFGDSDSFNNYANNNINIVQYIWAWLSYIISLKENEGIKNLNDFYKKYIKDKDNYNEKIDDFAGYTSYQDLINKNTEYITTNNSDMSKFYAPFKVLCNMFIECNEKNKDCNKCSQYAEEFVNKYNEVNCNSDTNINSSSSQILSTLLTDYNNFKKYFSEKCSYCSNSTTLPDIKATKSSAQDKAASTVQDHGDKSAQDSADISLHSSIPGHSDDSVRISLPDNADNPAYVSEFKLSNSSTASKLIPILSIFVVIPIFLGISYKYSLFGIDRRIQRHFRGKIKK